MKEINLARILTQKRKEKGLTQDDLASYVGVSKASVSKWETGQSFPDILLLPILATYFNITIDELIGYSPQLDHNSIERLYTEFTEKFVTEPFDNVISEIEQSIRKYYACMLLIYKMAILLTNHFMLASSPEHQSEVLKKIEALCERIKLESDDLKLVNSANSLQAAIYLIQQEPLKVIENLEGILNPTSSDEPILASAYQLLGKTDKAIEILQAGQYNYLMKLIGILPSYALACIGDPMRFNEVVERSLGLIAIFEIAALNPGIAVQTHLAFAQGYMQMGNKEYALDQLEKYTELCTHKLFPIRIKGDAYFNQIEAWFEEIEVRTQAPRSEKVIGMSMIQGLEANPFFAAISEEPRFKSYLEQLKNFYRTL
ncbi:MAG: hypothetical protein BGO41_01225 [Clostridiales bacterium 38-18]|nr:MAG: hypothetical protein BGO41_01225 [Clostridiales bacterium 38-18]